MVAVLSGRRIAVEREVLFTWDAAIGLALAAVVLVGANAFAIWRERSELGILFSFFVVGLLLVAWRRYLRSVTYEPDAALIAAVGVLPFVRFSVPLASLDSVYATPVLGIDRQGRYNLVVRRKGAIQPLVLEVRTEREDAMARAFLEHFPLGRPESRG